MNAIYKIKKERQNKLSAAMEEVGMFFAFSDTQFEESKTPLIEGDKYLSLGSGTYLPKSNLDKWKEKTEIINKWFINEVEQQREDYIRYELSNHETYYTGDIDSAFEALEGNFSREEVQAVFNIERQKEENYA